MNKTVSLDIEAVMAHRQAGINISEICSDALVKNLENIAPNTEAWREKQAEVRAVMADTTRQLEASEAADADVLQAEASGRAEAEAAKALQSTENAVVKIRGYYDDVTIRKNQNCYRQWPTLVNNLCERSGKTPNELIVAAGLEGKCNKGGVINPPAGMGSHRGV